MGARWTRSVAGSAVVGSTPAADPAPPSGRLCGTTRTSPSRRASASPLTAAPPNWGWSLSSRAFHSPQWGLAPRPGPLWPEHPEATVPGSDPPADADPARTTFPRMPRGSGVPRTPCPRMPRGTRARPHLAPARGCTRPAPEVATGSRAGWVEWVQVRPLERRVGGGRRREPGLGPGRSLTAGSLRGAGTWGRGWVSRAERVLGRGRGPGCWVCGRGPGRAGGVGGNPRALGGSGPKEGSEGPVGGWTRGVSPQACCWAACVGAGQGALPRGQALR